MRNQHHPRAQGLHRSAALHLHTPRPRRCAPNRRIGFRSESPSQGLLRMFLHPRSGSLTGFDLSNLKDFPDRPQLG